MLYRTATALLAVPSRISSSAQRVGVIRGQSRSIRQRGVSQFTKHKLNTGATIPALGFGTWQDVDAQEAAVLTALKEGYRHIDTARVYGTEPAVGKAIKDSSIPREDLFITTKLWNNSHHPDDVGEALEASLKDLGMDYVDLYLMHWPSAFKSGKVLRPTDGNGNVLTDDIDYVETYKAMEELVSSGKVKAIGVSNFSHAELERLLSKATIVPAAHQMEMHPWLQQVKFAQFHRSNGIHITQYSPFGNQNEVYDSGKSFGKLLEDPVLVDIARSYGKTSAQVALAWGIACGHSVIPKSKTPSRIKQNLGGDFTLGSEDLKKIGGIDKKVRFNDPSKRFGHNYYADLDGKKN